MADFAVPVQAGAFYSMPSKPGTHKPITRITERHGDRDRAVIHRLYGYKWQQARKAWLMAHPLCVHCQAQGIDELATEVDHIESHCGDRALFWNKGNWQSLCKPCHSRKTALEDGGFGHYKG